MRAHTQRLPGPLGGSFIGIDVGENFLDLAILDTPPRTLVLKRVPLDRLNGSACATLAERIKEAVPGVDAHVSVLVDSPRWPRDLDWSNPPDKRDPVPREREIDVELKRIFPLLMGAPDGKPYKPGLAMFPTPRYDYFTQWADALAGKPHLSGIAKELFSALLNGNAGGPTHGGTFTRFMLAGFATYRALEGLGIDAFESYPDLQLRLSSPSTALPPKKRHAEALSARRDIVASLARDLDLPGAPVLRTLDEADAAAMALAAACSACKGKLWTVSHPCEGRFMLALDDDQTRRLGPGSP
ncbi:MAG: hypothetical protein ACXWNE_10095 [Candidatus Binataceae bacterium]